METLGAYAVKAHLSGLLKRVEKGESFTITRNGVPVAQLIPVGEQARPDVAQTIADIRRFRQERPLGGLSHAEIKALINEGRRL